MSYPSELTSQLKAGDQIIKYVPLKYGWIALTEERVLYNARIYYEDTKTHQNETGNIPISKISSMTIKDRKEKGCLGKKRVVLEVNVQGAKYAIEVGIAVDAVRPLITEFNART